MFRNIIRTVFLLIASPPKGWRRVHVKGYTHQDFIANFLFPLFGMVAVTTFVGGLWLEPDGGIHWALKQTIVVVSALFGGFHIAAYVLNELFPRFGLERDLPLAQQFAGYSSVLLYVLYLVMPLLPGFSLLWVAVVYTVYMVYTGCVEYLEVEKNKRMNFAVASTLVILFSPVLIDLLLSFFVKIR